MSQVTRGIRAILSNANVYQAYQDFLGDWQKSFIETFVKPEPFDIVLDVGCGTAALADYLPNSCEYTGVDLSAEYIAQAKATRGARGTFICASVNDLDFSKIVSPTLVLAVGLLHHLSDMEARKLIFAIHRIVAEGGRLVTLDPCHLVGANLFARFLVGMDRGQNVRSLSGYEDIALSVFEEVSTDISRDLLRIPYNHAILTCRR